MKQFIKFLFVLMVSISFVLVGFYLWASSPNLNKNLYNSTQQYKYPSSISSNSTFSIISYNIGYLSGMTNNLPVENTQSLFENNLTKVVSELKKINADIIAFQEIDYDSDRSFNINQHLKIAELGYNFTGQNINWDKKYVPFPYYPLSMHFGKIISGQSVLSKYKITGQERIELDRNEQNPFYYDSFYLDRLAQIMKIRIQDETVVLINVHLEAYDQKTRMQQTLQVKELYLKYAHQFPTILLGDFNSDISFQDSSIRELLDLPKIGCSLFEASHSQKTFNSRTPTERLDYIFYTKDFIQEIDAEILTQMGEASDHLPILMKFKFKNKYHANLRQQSNTKP